MTRPVKIFARLPLTGGGGVVGAGRVVLWSRVNFQFG